MITDFSALGSKYFKVSDIFVTKQASDEKTSIDMCASPRSTDALLLFTSGTAICYQEGHEPYFISQGTLMYMPKGSRYTWDVLPSVATGTQERILFEFTLNEEYVHYSDDVKNAVSTISSGESIHFSDHVIMVSCNHFKRYEALFTKLLNQFNEKESPLKIYQTIYEIFSFIADDIKSKSTRNDFSAIQKGIDYLEQKGNYDLKINELADMCNVSLRYFEKLFREYSGVSPKEYIDSRRISEIKIMICENKKSLEEIADILSFCDSGHLCRFFKQKTGLTPKEYKRLYKN